VRKNGEKSQISQRFCFIKKNHSSTIAVQKNHTKKTRNVPRIKKKDKKQWHCEYFSESRDCGPLSRSLLGVDALSDQISALDEGDELAVLEESLDDGVVGGVGGIHLRVNHLVAVEGDRRLDGAVIGRRLVELDALLEGDIRGLEGGCGDHLPRVAVLGDGEVGLEGVAHLAEEHADSEVLHVLVESLLRIESPRGDQGGHDFSWELETELKSRFEI